MQSQDKLIARVDEYFKPVRAEKNPLSVVHGVYRRSGTFAALRASRLLPLTALPPPLTSCNPEPREWVVHWYSLMLIVL